VTTATTAATTPSTARTCPTGTPSAEVTSFSIVGHDDGTNDYVVRVAGMVQNTTSATITVGNVQYVVSDGNGAPVYTGTAIINRTMAPGATASWSEDVALTSESAPASAHVSSIVYIWSDAKNAGCPT
jgi:hypothetical protein